MAVKPFVRTSTLQQAQPIVDKDGRPLAWFVRLINDNNGNVTEAINQIALLPAIQDALEQAQAAVVVAQDAADAAQAAADAAQQQADGTSKEAALQGSYIDPDSVVSFDGTDILIAGHNRIYGDGVIVVVSAGAVTPAGTGVRYVSYLDPARTGGAVTYVATSTLQSQTGDRHNVGAITVPGTGTATGGRGPLPPGYVQP